jgi:rhodanese-related sulfurtransferase
MSKRYIFLVIISLSTILLLALLPSRRNCFNEKRDSLHLKTSQCKGEKVEEFLLNSLNRQRYIDVDNLAARIIEEDPSYMVIDLRDSEQFSKFSLPGSVNVPFDKLFDGKNREVFENDTYKKVLVSNGTLQSDQAWMLMRRKGYMNVKVLYGGLNEFFRILINPLKPGDLEPTEAFDTYSFRKAAGVYFGLPNPEDFIPEYSGSAGSGQINSVPSAAKISGNGPQKTAKPSSKKIAAPKSAVVEEEGC